MTTGQVSLIATVLNEMGSIRAWTQGIERQARPPDEVVIVDGGSTDGTLEYLRAWMPDFPVTVLERPNCTISEGRNEAIRHARHDLIAVTDAGTVADECWLARLMQVLSDETVDVASGFFRPALDDDWSRALAAVTLPDAREIREERFQPSSRSVAFRRSWWEAGVQYPEWLDYCEDLVWDFALRRAGARFAMDKQAGVTFQVRPDVRSFFLQYYRYARGDGKAGLFPMRHLLRYATYGALLVVLLRRDSRELALLGVLGSAYMRRPAIRLVSWHRRDGVPAVRALELLPIAAVLRAVGDIAKMAGYPAGLAWRLRTRGALGWKTSWRRTTPQGSLFAPARLTTGSPQQSGSPGGGSQQDST